MTTNGVPPPRFAPCGGKSASLSRWTADWGPGLEACGADGAAGWVAEAISGIVPQSTLERHRPTPEGDWRCPIGLWGRDRSIPERFHPFA